MKKFYCFLTCFFIISQSIFAVDPLTNNNPVELQEIVVVGAPATDVKDLPMTVSVVTQQQIEERHDQSLLPVLAEQVPGLFITSRGVMGYGVANGAAGTMTIRGVGGSPSTGVLLLIDGHPQYMGLMGHPLADSYQSMMAERVEVVSGPASALYGSNAMGGVINIVTKKQTQDGVKTGINFMYGSYNTLSTEINNAIRAGKFNSYVSLDYNRTDGHRENMDFEQYSGYAKVGYDISDHWKTFADLNLTNYKASNPGTVNALLIDNDVDIIRGMTSFSLENNYKKTSGALKFFYNFGNHEINDGYKPGGQPLDYRFHSKDNMLGASLFQSYSFFKGNLTTAKIDYQHVGGDARNEFLNKQTPDNNLVDKSMDDIAGYLNIRQVLFVKLILNAAIRLDYNDYFGSAEWIPQLGLNYLPSKNTTLKAIVSKGFRYPTIREMYMFPPQNPELQPEELVNYELSGLQNLLEKRLNIGLNLYYIKGDNSIQTALVDGKPKNVNTGKIENYGLELSSRYNINSHLDVSLNYAWLHMEYKVVASPEHKLYAGVNYVRKKWSASTGVQYVGNLYTTVGNNPSTGSFVLWNVRGSYRPVKILEIFAKGENLLDQQYEINAGYPMPGIMIFGGLNVTL